MTLRPTITVLLTFGLLLACDRSPSAAGAGSASATPEPVAAVSAAAAGSASAPSAVALAVPAPTASVGAGSSDAAVAVSDDATAGQPQDGGAAGATAAKKAGGKASTSVQLLSPGAEPRRELRYALTAGTTDRMQIVNESKVSMVLEGKESPAPPAPTTKMLIALTVDSIDANGYAHRTFRVESASLVGTASLPAETQKAITESLTALEQIKGHDQIDPLGMVKNVRVDASGVDNPQLKEMFGAMEQTVGQTGAPFPVEAVGVGAKWQVKNKVEQLGLKLEQTATYELEQIDGQKGRLALKLVQKAPGGKLKPPGLPAGAKAELLGMSGSGSGKIRFDLGRCVSEGSLDTKADVKVRASMGGEDQQMSMKMKGHVEFKPLGRK